MDFSITKAKKAFLHLQKPFIKESILYYFDSECHICIETDVLGYAISKNLSQISLDYPNEYFSNLVNLKNHSDFSESKIGQWHSVDFFSQKTISVRTWYEINH